MIAPLAKLLAETGDYDITVTGYGHAIARFERHQLAYTLIDKVERNDSVFFNRFMPDLVITSATSLPSKDMSEKHIWILAKKAGIKSIAILDQWQNYAIRFSGVSDQEHLAYMPDAINCIDEVGKNEMIEEGFDESILYPLGQPYLNQLETYAKEMDCILIREKLNLSKDENVVLFVSEAIEENYGKERGYTQYDALYTLLKNAPPSNDTSILIKLHPKDDLDKFKGIRDQFTRHKLIFVSTELTALEAIVISNRVFGMTSIMLIEAYILGKSVVSIQPNLNVTDPLILSRCGYVKLILDKAFKFDLITNLIPAVDKKLEFKFKQPEFMALVTKLL